MKKFKVTLLLAILITYFGVVEIAAVQGQDLVPANGSSQGAMSRVNLQRSGVYQTKGLHQVKEVLWKSEVLCKRAESNVYSLPIILDSFVYFTCGSSRSRSDGIGDWNYFSDDFVYALDVKTGRQIWKFQMKQSNFSNLAVALGLVFFGSDSGYFGNAGGVFFALDAKTGQEKWTYTVKNSLLSAASPAVADGVVYFRDKVGGLYALNAQTGKPMWTFNTKGQLTAAAILDGRIYFGSSKGLVYAVDTKTGVQHWEFNVGDPVGDPVISEGLIYFLGKDKMYALEAETGKQVLQIKLSRKLGSFFALTEKTMYYGGSSEDFYAIDAQTGAEKWRFKTGKPCLTPVIADGAVYFSCFDGNLYALNLKTGKQVWRVESKPSYSYTPAVFDGTIYFPRIDGRIYAVR